MTEWPTKTANQLFFGFFVPIEVFVPALSGVHPHGGLVVVVHFHSVLKSPGRGCELMFPAVLLPGRADAFSSPSPRQAADDKQKKGYGPAEACCCGKRGSNMGGGYYFEDDEGHCDQRQD